MPGMASGVTAACFSASGHHLLLGSCDGAVRVYPVTAPFHLPQQGQQYWEAQVHDMHCAVTGVCLSFDDTSLTSAAADGSCFTFTLAQECAELRAGQAQAGRANSELCTVAEWPEAAVEDVAGHKEYTIEEAKQKVEEDAVRAEAEAKKLTVREELAQCALCTLPPGWHVRWNSLV